MTDKELKKLSRKQLLELLLKQTERADLLEQELKQLQKKLEDKTLGVNESGSIAEAALKLNGVFEAAQAAADQYLENIKRLHDSCVAEAQTAQKNANEQVSSEETPLPLQKTQSPKPKNGVNKRCKKKKSRSRTRK